MADENNALSGEQDAIAENVQETVQDEAAPADDAAQADAEADDAEQGDKPGDEASKAKVEAEDDDATADESDDEDKPKRNRKSAKERISQLTQQKRDAEREAARLRAQLDRYKEAQRPDPNKYDDPDEYASDLAAYKVRQSSAVDIEESAKAAQQSAQQALAAAYQERVMDFAAETPDFQAVAGNPALPITEVMAEQIMDSDVGPQVQYYLGKNPREASRIAALSPAQQIREIGRLEARVSTPAPKRITQAPAPIKPVAGNRVNKAFDPEKASVEEYVAKRRDGWGG